MEKIRSQARIGEFARGVIRMEVSEFKRQNDNLPPLVIMDISNPRIKLFLSHNVNGEPSWTSNIFGAIWYHAAEITTELKPFHKIVEVEKLLDSMSNYSLVLK